MFAVIHRLTVTILLCGATLFAAHANTENRLALLIGNQHYKLKAINLANPHNDIVAVGKALRAVGFKVRLVRDAELGTIHREINRYAKALRQAGPDAIGFFYYSGHGALNEGNRYNYIIPTDVETLDSSDLWDGAVRLRRIIDDLKDKARNALHFVVFDACRNELRLTSQDGKSLTQPKGFTPFRETVRGMLIAYATAEGQMASDAGDGLGPYASELAKTLVRPGIEAVSMFREVQINVFKKIGQEPWYTHGALRPVYLAGRPVRNSPDQRAAEDWQKLGKNYGSYELRSFANRHKDTALAAVALELAAKIEQHKVRLSAAKTPILLAKRDWQLLKEKDDPNELRTFAKRHANTALALLAQDLATELERKSSHLSAANAPIAAATQEWQSLKDRNDTAALRAFAERHKATPLARIAKDLASELERQKSRLDAVQAANLRASKEWEAIRNKNDPDLLRSFANNHAGLVLAKIALELANEIERQRERLQAFQAPIDAASREWRDIKNKNDPASLRAFADRHKNTALAKIAIDVAAELERQKLETAKESEAPSKWEGLTAGQPLRDCPICPELVVVPPGRFRMGDDKGEPEEKPAREVSIAYALAVAKTEVTFNEWDACVSDGGCAHRPKDAGWGRAENPVIFVSWDDITRQYLPWLRRKSGKNFRLLSEAEWEYVARAGTDTTYSFGNKITSNDARFSAKSPGSAKRPTKVGSYKANGFGLYDTHGNVWEWVQDCYGDSFRGAPVDGSPLPIWNCEKRVLRGGSWFSAPKHLRSAARVSIHAHHRGDFIGFRVARQLSKNEGE
ncbi:MAG: SUMF1/EgtB/PvdO family nonheme iron enzyme [Pseudomonadota bacterium]